MHPSTQLHLKTLTRRQIFSRLSATQLTCMLAAYSVPQHLQMHACKSPQYTSSDSGSHVCNLQLYTDTEALTGSCTATGAGGHMIQAVGVAHNAKSRAYGLVRGESPLCHVGLGQHNSSCSPEHPHLQALNISQPDMLTAGRQLGTEQHEAGCTANNERPVYQVVWGMNAIAQD